MRTLRVRATGAVVGPHSLSRLRQFKDWPPVQVVPLDHAQAAAVEDFDVDVIDERALARLHLLLDLEFPLTGVRPEILDALGWLPAVQR